MGWVGSRAGTYRRNQSLKRCNRRRHGRGRCLGFWAFSVGDGYIVGPLRGKFV